MKQNNIYKTRWNIKRRQQKNDNNEIKLYIYTKTTQNRQETTKIGQNRQREHQNQNKKRHTKMDEKQLKWPKFDLKSEKNPRKLTTDW